MKIARKLIGLVLGLTVGLGSISSVNAEALDNSFDEPVIGEKCPVITRVDASSLIDFNERDGYRYYVCEVTDYSLSLNPVKILVVYRSSELRWVKYITIVVQEYRGKIRVALIRFGENPYNINTVKSVLVNVDNYAKRFTNWISTPDHQLYSEISPYMHYLFSVLDQRNMQ